jgi:hypothetical protein
MVICKERPTTSRACLILSPGCGGRRVWDPTRMTGFFAFFSKMTAVVTVNNIKHGEQPMKDGQTDTQTDTQTYIDRQIHR